MQKDLIYQELLKCNGDMSCINRKIKLIGIRGVEFSLKEVGEILKISKERVRQIEKLAFKKFRHPQFGKNIINYL
jgi:DNA-directed RNA polymerase sigma subunit (sigma70/sigma32)